MKASKRSRITPIALPSEVFVEDGGQTWTHTLVNRMVDAGIQTSVASDTAGNLNYVWWGGKNFLPYMAVSRDHGKTFGPAVLIAPPGVKAVNCPTIDAGIVVRQLAGPGVGKR